MTNKLHTFINKSKLVHPNENIDYSKVNYINNRTSVLLIDHDLNENGIEYGEYWQTPSNHLKGQSHPLKRKLKISKSKSLKQNDIIERFNETHKDENLDYSEVNYINMHTKIKIIDHSLNEEGIEYGEYWQEPVVHLKGCGHPMKGKEKQIKSMYSNTEEFINKAKLIHYLKDYDYSKVSYKNNRDKVIIICKHTNNNGIHGEFMISPYNCLRGKGCPICNESKLENEISLFLNEHNIIYERQKRFKWLGRQSLDFYLPDYKIAIECQGRQHFESVDYFGGENNFKLIVKRDENKNNLCKLHNVKLLYFSRPFNKTNKKLYNNNNTFFHLVDLPIL